MTTTITIETLRKRAAKFAKEFENISSEKQHDQNFMRGFAKIFGINARSIEWQYWVQADKKSPKKWIDGLIPSSLLFEIKSAGEDLDKAYKQAADYAALIKASHQPDYILISDFQNLHLYNRVTGDKPITIKLGDLAQNIELFLFLTGYEKLAIEKRQKINEHAAEKMANLHDAIKNTGYDGKDLESYLIRLLFCLFADSTGLLGENGAFLDYLHNYTKEDGSDLHGALTQLFDTLNQADEAYLTKNPSYKGQKRLKNLPQHLAKFPYINGALFEGSLKGCYFDEQSRELLIECARLDWSDISPAIFGSLFQAIMHDEDDAKKAKTKKRREFGAHYTSEENILKTIKPLFLDDLWAEFNSIPLTHQTKLVKFHQKLAKLTFFDPACGCGNFLIIAYRELRLLELEVIKRQCGKKPTDEQIQSLILCDVDQFYGIDIDESAVYIALVAMWLTDHQVNLKVQQLGTYYHRIPLIKKANIVHANALQLDWQTVINPKECSYIMGNPPFIGKKEQSVQQKNDIQLLSSSIKGAGVLDYVSGWYLKATAFIQYNPKITVAFVSTNSICQGEQVGVLWSYLSAQGIKIHFAHRSFRWSNEGRGVAAVHCVIIGFGLKEPSSYRLFNYPDIKAEPIEIKATQINPYLVDAPIIQLEKRTNPISKVSAMNYGSMPIDDGHLILSEAEKNQLLNESMFNEQFIFEYMGGDEFINNQKRWCLWLENAQPEIIKNSAFIMARIKQVKEFRNSSGRETTKKLASYPMLFGERRQPKQDYLLLPKVSSENRDYMPIGFIKPSVIANGSALIIPNANQYLFGVLQSKMHMAWLRTVCGRMKSDYQYSASIVYNNFPFPSPNKKQIIAIEKQAQLVLDVRNNYKNSTLADLYNPLTMPANLVKAHKQLDNAVDLAYGYKGAKDDAARVAFLFMQYQQLIAPLLEAEQVKKPKKSRIKL